MGILRTDKISGLETPTAVTGSVYFDGTGDYLSIASSSDFTFGTGDFTVELYVNATNFTNRGTFYDSRAVGGTTGITIGHEASTGELRVYMNATSGSDITAQSTDFTTDTWYHVAVTRSSGTVRLFIDGILKDSGTRTSDMNNTNAVNIGYKTYDSSGYDYFSGYVSNFRILRGTALYTSNFTVPTHALEVIGDTVLLCCNNPDSAGADGTGKTITANGDAAASTVSPGLTRDFTSGTEFSGVTVFDTQGYFVPPSGTTEQRGRGRGISGGVSKAMEYIQISSMGNALDFGDMTYSVAGYTASCSSSTRGLISGGFVAPNTGNNTIDAVTIASTGNAVNFGDIPQTAVYGMGGCSSSTRGLFAGGYKASSPAADAALLQINYVTIATFGNAQDFGDLTEGVRYSAGASSPTRGIFAGGRDSDSSPNNHNIISYVTIATLGNAQDFGDLLRIGYAAAGNNSSTRAVIAGGYAPGATNQIDYITIATTGNAQDFGELSQSARGGCAGMSNSIRGVFAGGANPSNVNSIEYVNIASTGDGQNFGDLITASSFVSGISDSHGGIS